MAIGAVVAAAVATVLAARGGASRLATGRGASAYVGGDLHSLVINPNRPEQMFVGGHQAVAVSEDSGHTWRRVRALDDADAMGWAFTATAVWQSGHPGVHRSTGTSLHFVARNDSLPATDVHALGGDDRVLYAASPVFGFAASSDGKDWDVRSATDGQAFFGRVVVDPADPDHAVAADARVGAVETRDGGRSWARLGGIRGADWVSRRGDAMANIVVTGRGESATSSDGGHTWQAISVPEGVTVVEGSPADPQVLYAAALRGNRARVWVSRDSGAHWQAP